ncbi:Uncharacterized protein HDE_02517 [Halotydeus destructor]|nr:Uncharacterized protein HDE_02517 [Halotydeus destructor]
MAQVTANDEPDRVYSVCSKIDVDDHLRKPKRLIHCTEGIVEVYENNEVRVQNQQRQSAIDTHVQSPPKSPMFSILGSVIPGRLVTAGSKFLEYCDYFGEKLAYAFGITSPKYQYEIDEYKKIKVEKEKEVKHQQDEYAGWMDVTKISLDEQRDSNHPDELEPLATKPIDSERF